MTINSNFLHNDIEGYALDDKKANSELIILKPDLSSIREMSWMKSKSYLVMADLYQDKNTPLAISPRNILKKQIEEMRKLGRKLVLIIYIYYN